MSYLIRKTDTFLRNWKKNGFRTILIMIRSIVLELKRYRNLNYVNQYQLDRLLAFPAYLLLISLYCLYIWNRKECIIMENKVWNRNYSILLIKSVN